PAALFGLASGWSRWRASACWCTDSVSGVERAGRPVVASVAIGARMRWSEPTSAEPGVRPAAGVTMNQTPTISWRDGHLVRDGERYRLLAGGLHYFRVHPDQWADRLLRLRAMGANTVDTYVAWNFHEQVEGEFRFDGWQDLEAFVRL